jgi:hypothetical protein
MGPLARESAANVAELAALLAICSGTRRVKNTHRNNG